MDNTKEHIRHLSLCSGYSGIGLGLRRVFSEVREISHVEIEAFAIANLVAKMEENKISPAPIWTDLKTFPYEKFLGKVDILSGGFPCQPFSQAGKRDGVEDPRHLYPYIADGIGRCRPRLVFLENVEGIISSKTETGRSVLRYVLQDLERMGYIAEAGIFSASEVGAPHQRKRVFIMGYSSYKGLEGLDEHCTSEYRENEGNVVGSRGSSGASKELAYNDSSRISRGGNSEKCGNEHDRVLGRKGERSSVWGEVSGCRDPHGKRDIKGAEFPSRPGEDQHDWEEPRTISKSKLGRTAPGTRSGVDPTANRVDRLRLLGNGVVPQTVEAAFRTLSKRIEERIKLI